MKMKTGRRKRKIARRLGLPVLPKSGARPAGRPVRGRRTAAGRGARAPEPTSLPHESPVGPADTAPGGLPSAETATPPEEYPTQPEPG